MTGMSTATILTSKSYKRYEAGFFNTDLFGHNPEWDEGDDWWSTRAMALKIAKDSL
jgi:hypothetical protein